MMEYSEETKKALKEFVDQLRPILQWQNEIDCAASYVDAENVRKRFAPNSLPWRNEEEEALSSGSGE